MSQWITEEQTPHLRLSAEAEEVLYSGESEFQKIEVFKSKEYGMMLALDGVHTVFGKVIEGMDVVDGIHQGDIMETVEVIEG